MSAMDEKYADMDDFALTEELEKISGVKIPDAITKIRNAPVLHNIQCEKDGMKQAVMEFLENNRMRALRAFQCHKSQRDG